MDRNKAITEICSEQIKVISSKNRTEILLSWWGIDEDDAVFHDLPTDLQNEIISTEYPPENVMDKRYDPLIMEALKHRYIGVRNDYISEQLSALLGDNIIVEGETEDLHACPCCTYKTLSMRGHYFICPVCHWEDDGNNGNDEASLNRYSSPNHMTLAEAKNHFNNLFIANSDTISKTSLLKNQSMFRAQPAFIDDMARRYHK